MSLLPKKIKDLPPLEPDSEDDRTPIKPKEVIKSSRNRRTSSTVFQLRPIRVSDMSMFYDSDQENDDNKMDDTENESLNKSFIFSTNKKLSPNSIKKNDKNILNDRDREKYSNDTGYGDSLAFHFNKCKIEENNAQLTTGVIDNDKNQLINEQQSISQPRRPFSLLNKAKMRTIEEGDGNSLYSLPDQSKSPLEFSSKNLNFVKRIKEKQQQQSVNLFDNNFESNLDCSFKNVQNSNQRLGLLKPSKSIDKDFQYNQPIIEKNITNNEPPIIVLQQQQQQQQQSSQCNTISNKKPQIDNIPYISTETPYKLNEINFITPHIKSTKILPISRQQQPQSIQFGSTTQKTRLTNTTNENDYRSQKILFQTPYAVSRPPVSSITNYSISLGLDDTPIPSADDINNNDDEILFKSTRKNLNSEMSSGNENKPEMNRNINVTAVNEVNKNQKIIVINQKEYILLKKLGTGGSSSVFLAQRKCSNNECAIKIVDLRGDELVIEGYLNETKLLAKLQGNINVVSLFEYEHIEKRSTLLMVMEKGDSDLYKILQSYKSDIPLYRLMNYWLQILQAVDYIHKNGVIHSDLKPANFLLVNGRLKLIDFGIASRIPNDSTSIIKFSQAGTFNYISPEALIDISTGNSPCKDQPKIKISTKSDVWSLGCIMYLFLYKKTPFGHIKNNYAKANLISNPSTVIEYPKLSLYYPPILIEMAQKCLIHNPKNRLSVAELLKYPFDMVIPIDNL